MRNRSIVSALGCMMILLLLGGCLSLGKSLPPPIQIATKPVNKPELVLPKADEISAREIEWTLITPETSEEVFAKQNKTGRPLVLFGLTDKGYKNLALNISEIRMYISQQQAIIEAYKRYYIAADGALADAVTVE